jgi:hypothetical protein
VSNSGGAAVHVHGNAWASLSAITGTGNASYGLLVDSDGARGVSDGSSTVTGASGDVHIGPITETWAQAGTTIATPTPMFQFATGSRPAASSVPSGFAIYNTTTHALNISDGSTWRDALGNAA